MHQLPENEVKDILEEYGIPTTTYELIENERDLHELKLKFPLALKVCSRSIPHKTEVGGVKLGIKNMEELIKSFKEFKKKFPKEKFLVEEMEEKGIEIIAGLIKDPTFGISIMVGIGGIFTELYEDVSFRILPINEKDAKEMLSELRGKKIFNGFRNIEVDKKAMIDLLLKLSKLGMDHEVKEMDLNPIFLYSDGLVVVDAKLIMRD